MIGEAHEHVVRKPRRELLGRVLHTRGGQVSRARPLLGSASSICPRIISYNTTLAHKMNQEILLRRMCVK